MRTPTLIFCCAALFGCATAPGPVDLARLEAEARARPADPQTALFLAAAQLNADRAADADATLSAVPLPQRDDPLRLVLGLVAEERGRLEDARTLYRSYRDDATAEPFRSEAARRLEVVEQRLLPTDVRALVQAANATEPDRGTIVVLPIVADPPDPQVALLATALTETLIDDVGKTSTFRGVERRKVEVAIAELGLAATDPSDPAVGAAVARVFGGGWVIQGRVRTLPADSVLLEGTMIGLVTSGEPLVGEFAFAGPRQQLPELEKQLALYAYALTGRTLAVYERNLVRGDRARAPEVWLAFAEGLTAADRGDFATARQHFARAAALDSDFSPAERAERRAALAAAAPSTRELAWSVAASRLQRVLVLRLSEGSGTEYAALLRGVAERDRAALAEALGLNMLGGAILDLAIELGSR